jgi:hypothetical protein
LVWLNGIDANRENDEKKGKIAAASFRQLD